MYVPKTTPFAHQQAAFDRFANAKVFALTWEQRCGKTKAVIDIAASRFERQLIDGLLIIAPNGVHRNWATDEIPAHIPDRIARHVLVWRAGFTASIKGKAAFDLLLTYPGLAVFCVNVDALITPRGRQAIKEFITRRTTFAVIDESSTIKTPGAARTKVALALKDLTTYRAILDGTPDTESPLELFSQYGFLDPNIFGQKSFYGFRARYAVLKQAYDPRSGRQYTDVVGYKNLEELTARKARHTYRVLRADVFGECPKAYQKRFYEMSDEQRRVYEALRTEFAAELSNGRLVTATNVLSRYLKLQQVLSNRLPATTEPVSCPICQGMACTETGVLCETCEGIGSIPVEQPTATIDIQHNPRLDALRQEVEGYQHPFIVWCRFRHEVTECMTALANMDITVRRCDGESDQDSDQATRAAFKHGSPSDGPQGIVGNAAKMARGFDLSRARLHVFYSNYYSLRMRLQAEDRTEHPAKRLPTDVVDLVCEGTIDETIVKSMREKRSLFEMINGDPTTRWL